MKHRVIDIMKTIQNAPPPSRHGEIKKIPIHKELVWYEDPMRNTSNMEQLLVLEAMQFSDNSGKRLEWVISFNQ